MQGLVTKMYQARSKQSAFFYFTNKFGGLHLELINYELRITNQQLFGQESTFCQLEKRNAP